MSYRSLVPFHGRHSRAESRGGSTVAPAMAAPVVASVSLLLALLVAAPAASAQDGTFQDPYAADDPYGDSSYSQASYEGDYGDGDYYEDGQPADYDSGYSYVRNLQGDATLIQIDGEREALTVNQPVLVGDRLWVAPGSMAEILLSDGNLLRVDGDSEVAFDALAGSPESRDDRTILRLLEGNVQLVVFEDALGDTFPRVDLPNALFQVATAGRYRLTSDRGDWSQVVSRRGRGDLVTPTGSEPVRAGFEVLVEGERAPRLLHRQAGGYDVLERWGERLDHQVADTGYVDDDLRYAAAPLDDYGSWVEVSGSRAWRPRVDHEWSPYREGRWRHTPLGLTWVSYEPWGWVPYHYGTWDHVAHYGWVWFPGRAFSPARVFWYWGPSHVAWVPVGYYSRHYRYGVRFGVYGWAGGSWDPFSRWVVCPTRYFGHRHQGRYAHRGRYWQRHHRGDLPRGILTTDTRPLTRDRWHDPEGAIRALRTRPGRGAVATRGGGRDGLRDAVELPDVTSFVARTDAGRLPQEVRRRVLRVDDGTDRGRRTAVTGHSPRVRAESGDRPSRAPSDTVGVGDGDRVIRRSPPASGAGAPRATIRGNPRAADPADRGDRAGERVTGVRGSRPTVATPARPAGPPGRTQVRPRVEGRPADTPRGGASRDRELSSSPRFRTGTGMRVDTRRQGGGQERREPSAGAARPAAPRTPAASRPKADDGSRSHSSGSAASRRDRAGDDRRSPAVRVLQGYRRGTAADSGRGRTAGPPSAQRRPAPRTSQPRASAPRTSSPSRSGAVDRRAPARHPTASSSPRPSRPTASSRPSRAQRPSASSPSRRSQRPSAGSRPSSPSRSSAQRSAPQRSSAKKSSSSSGGGGKAKRRVQRRDDGV